MNCYLCAQAGGSAAAVAMCPVCGIGLCLEHRSKQPVGPGGTSIGCRHARPGDEELRVAAPAAETH